MQVKKRGDSYRVRVRLKGVEDSKTFVRRADAVAWGTMREAEINAATAAGLIARTGNQTFREAAEKYRDGEALDKRGAESEVIRVNRLLREIDFADRKLTQVTPDILSGWARARAREVAPNTVIREASQISSIFTTARKVWGWLPEGYVNPCGRMWLPRVPPPRERLISPGERDRLLEALGYAEDKPLATEMQEVGLALLIALETAMRTSEIVEVTADRFFPQRRVVRLPLTKNGHARDVPLSLEAVRLFERLPKPEAKGGKLFRLSPDVCDVLFRRGRDSLPEGDPCHSITFRDSRATALTRLARKVDVMTLAKISGHRDLKILLNTYYRTKADDIALMLD